MNYHMKDSRNYSDYIGKETEVEHICPQCESENLFDDTPEKIKHKTMYVCEDCGAYFEILN